MSAEYYNRNYNRTVGGVAKPVFIKYHIISIIPAPREASNPFFEGLENFKLEFVIF
jgi:hypothetical protein